MTTANPVPSADDRRLRILIVSPQFPFPTTSGFTMRVYQLARQLATRHDVTLVAATEADDAPSVAALGRLFPVTAVRRERCIGAVRRTGQLRSLVSSRPFACMQIHTPQMQDAISRVCADTAFDLIQLESSMLCAYDFPAGVPIVLDEHNIEYELLQRMSDGERSLSRRLFSGLEYRRLRPFEERCWRAAAGCVVTSDREAPVITAAAPDTPTAIVPNGVDLEYFAPSNAPITPRTVVFNATLTYRPNLDAALHLVQDIWPLVQARCPEAQLTIVGQASEAEIRRFSRPGVVLTGSVPDVRPYLRQAAVVAVPVRMGGGTRLKVVEALAMGKAMVSTTLGSEGVDVRDQEHLLVGDGAPDFAARILELFDRPDVGDALGRAGRRRIEESYSWELAVDRLQLLYERIIPGARDGAPRPAAPSTLRTS